MFPVVSKQKKQVPTKVSLKSLRCFGFPSVFSVAGRCSLAILPLIVVFIAVNFRLEFWNVCFTNLIFCYSICPYKLPIIRM